MSITRRSSPPPCRVPHARLPATSPPVVQRLGSDPDQRDVLMVPARHYAANRPRRKVPPAPTAATAVHHPLVHSRRDQRPRTPTLSRQCTRFRRSSGGVARLHPDQTRDLCPRSRISTDLGTYGSNGVPGRVIFRRYVRETWGVVVRCVTARGRPDRRRLLGRRTTRMLVGAVL
jgi:hypothetical protein